MGTAIKTQIQIFKNNQWEDFEDQVFTLYEKPSCCPFAEQNYGLFGFLADVRNYTCIPILDEPRGLPDVDEPDFGDGLEGVLNRSCWEPWPKHCDNYLASWFLVSEMLNFNYDCEFEDRRGDDQKILPIGMGVITTVREYIGPKFFEDLEILKNLGDPMKTRVIISFSG